MAENSSISVLNIMGIKNTYALEHNIKMLAFWGSILNAYLLFLLLLPFEIFINRGLLTN